MAEITSSKKKIPFPVQTVNHFLISASKFDLKLWKHPALNVNASTSKAVNFREIINERETREQRKNISLISENPTSYTCRLIVLFARAIRGRDGMR